MHRTWFDQRLVLGRFVLLKKKTSQALSDINNITKYMIFGPLVYEICINQIFETFHAYVRDREPQYVRWEKVSKYQYV